ncbi:hypothetical protein J4G33_07640 [Actinotalea sp. BY-33]|uniref:Uncharacterized protein n=1 Tax=Actinotalea soli TaxID=2819234 RepID=A0A939RVJ1_9CELL|nr:hypothetical protein [Actinotalea soli]MBO1751673.1 hypothetical protein [Actinotalea soli]
MVVDKITPHDEDQVDSSTVPEDEASQEVMSLLSQHVPLALLADLAVPSGPASPQILEDEGLPDVAWWEGEDESREAEKPGEENGDASG